MRRRRTRSEAGPGRAERSASAALPVPPGARDLSLGNPDPALLPDLACALARTELPVRLYGEPAAVPELAALAHEQLRADGIPGEPPCIVSGALDGIERVIEAHLRPGDRVAVENPGYAALFDLLRARGLVLEAVAVDRRGMRPAELQAALERGASAAAATRSVAKALGPDLRLAALAADPQTLARVQGRQQCGPGWVSHILQRLVLHLSRDPQVLELIERASITYTVRREQLLDALDAHGVSASGASGLNVWIPVQEETAAVGALLQRGWVLAPGAPFRLAGSPPALRVTIATLAARETQRLAADLADVLAPSRARRSG